MTSKRTPINRPPRATITPAALEAFRKMQRLERRCTCEEPDWDGAYWNQEQCPACEQWWAQHSILHGELRLRPWQWPAYRRPDGTESPPDSAQDFEPDGGPVVRYRMLKQAARGGT
jgi:hypothetical protein